VPVLVEKGREKRSDGFNSLGANNTAETMMLEIERADACSDRFSYVHFVFFSTYSLVLSSFSVSLPLFVVYIYPLSISSFILFFPLPITLLC